MRHPLGTMVFPAQAGIQRNVAWTPAFAGMTHRDTRLACLLEQVDRPTEPAAFCQ